MMLRSVHLRTDWIVNATGQRQSEAVPVAYPFSVSKKSGYDVLSPVDSVFRTDVTSNII